MKKTIKYILGFVLALGFSQCSLDTEVYDQIPTEDAFSTAQDVSNAMNGAYQKFGDYTFYGNYAVSISDMTTDIATADPSSGHMVSFNNWIFDEYSPELLDMWETGYKVLDWCTRGISGGAALIAKGGLTDAEKQQVLSCISQMYSLRAMSSFVLVNYYGLPYKAGTSNDALGIVLLTNQPIDAFKKVSRSTVGQTYTQILSDIAQAKTYMNQLEEKGAVNQYYFNEAAIFAMEARVRINMQDYDGAAAAAQRAIDLRDSGDETADSYVSMWSSTAVTNEDIFTIVKSSADNLSSNSLNTLYSSYGGGLTPMVTGLVKSTDIRSGLIDGSSGLKYSGIPSAADVSNVPVFRKSEMYLILAESNLRKAAPDLDAAKDALIYTAKRDASYKVAADLPATKAELLTFVENENIREFFQEGHRMFDLRRTGNLANIGGTSNFEFSKFVFPIPGEEVLSGFGVVQNPDWDSTKP